MSRTVESRLRELERVAADIELSGCERCCGSRIALRVVAERELARCPGTTECSRCGRSLEVFAVVDPYTVRQRQAVGR